MREIVEGARADLIQGASGDARSAQPPGRHSPEGTARKEPDQHDL
jgi:hypothetical protein